MNLRYTAPFPDWDRLSITGPTEVVPSPFTAAIDTNVWFEDIIESLRDMDAPSAVQEARTEAEAIIRLVPG